MDIDTNGTVRRDAQIGRRARSCSRCHCAEINACIVVSVGGELRGCHWSEEGTLCSACDPANTDSVASIRELLHSATTVVARMAAHLGNDDLRCALALLVQAVRLMMHEALDRARKGE